MSRIQKMEVTNRHDDLLPRWKGLWMSLGVWPGRVPDLEKLISSYEAPTRHYHNLGHIRDCLRELDSCRHLAKEPNVIEVAIWFHDAVYDPMRHDNEEQSANMASRTLFDAGISQPIVDRVKAMILATRHVDPPIDDESRFIVDIDLSILGRPDAEFDEYERAIRLEYQHVQDEAFRSRRAMILQKLLDRPQIYSTDLFQRRYEQAARQNLRRSIGQLSNWNSASGMT